MSDQQHLNEREKFIEDIRHEFTFNSNNDEEDKEKKEEFMNFIEKAFAEGIARVEKGYAEEIEAKDSEIQTLKNRLDKEKQNKESIFVNLTNTANNINSEELLDVKQFCKTKADHKIASLLLKAMRQIRVDQQQCNKNLEKLNNKELATVYKNVFNKSEGSNEEIRDDLLDKLLENMNWASSSLEPFVKYAYNTLWNNSIEMISVEKQILFEVENRNLNIENPIGDREKFIETPVFSGEVSFNSYHVYEFWSFLITYIDCIEMDHETAPAMIIKKALTGEAKTIVNRKYGKTIPSLKDLKSFLEEEFGREQVILDEIMYCHWDLGMIDYPEDFYLEEMIIRSYKHIDLYQKAILLEKRKPGLVYDSDKYLYTLHNIFEPKYRLIVKFAHKNATKKEEREHFVTEIRILIRKLETRKKVLKRDSKRVEFSSGSTEPVNDSQNAARPDSEFSSGSAEPVNAARPDYDGKCAICHHFQDCQDIDANAVHLFSPKGNLETDSCPLIRNLPISTRYEMLAQSFCTICLYKKKHENCKLPSNMEFLKCSFNDCNNRFIICPYHSGYNKKKLVKRKKDLQAHGIFLNICPFSEQ